MWDLVTLGGTLLGCLVGGLVLGLLLDQWRGTLPGVHIGGYLARNRERQRRHVRSYSRVLAGLRGRDR